MNSNWSCSLETPNLGQIWWFLELCDLEIWRMTLKNNRAPLLCYFKLFASFHMMVNSNWGYSPEMPNLSQIWWFLEQCDLEVWQMTLKNNRAPLLCYFKLCASFRSHWWIQTGVTVRKRSIWVKFDDIFFYLCDLDLWPLTSTFCMDITSVIGNNSCKFHDDRMMGT